MSSDDQDPLLEDAFYRFFTSGDTPVNTHEEWLLRMCAQLMHREANVVRILEQNLTNKGRQPRRRRATNGSSTTSDGSIPHSTGMDPNSFTEYS